MTPLPHRDRSVAENIFSVVMLLVMLSTIGIMLWFGASTKHMAQTEDQKQHKCEVAGDFWYQGMCFKPNSIVTNP